MRGISAEDLRGHVLAPLMAEFKKNYTELHPRCKEQILGCILCAVLWGGKELLGEEAGASKIWEGLKGFVIGELGNCLSTWAAAIEEGIRKSIKICLQS